MAVHITGGYGNSSYSSISSSSESSGSGVSGSTFGRQIVKTLQAISGPMGTQGHCSECKSFTLIGNSTGSRKICSNCGHTESTAICPDCGSEWVSHIVECPKCHSTIPEEQFEPTHIIEHKVVDLQFRPLSKATATTKEKSKLAKLLDEGYDIVRADVIQESSSTYARIIYILRRSTITYEVPEPKDLPSRSMEL